MQKKRISWGIIALGHIAEKFAKDIPLADDAVLYAVASRDIKKAERFAKTYNAVKYYGNYEELAHDPNVDVVYIAGPHVFHYEHSMMCMEAGKSVLCEKPAAVNHAQLLEMTEKAKEKQVFFMEALWTLFIPANQIALELMKEGHIGKPQIVKADFGFKADYNPEKRLFNKQLAGGSLLDIGIYPVLLSLLVFGKPLKIQATANFSSTGVDSSCAMLFDYTDGQNAILDSTLLTNTATEAWIYGDKAALKLHSRFHHAQKLSVYKEHECVETFDVDYRGNGYVHEIDEVTDCLKNGRLESESIPHTLSLDLAETLDRVREIIGLQYDTAE
jgi:predicted dehydrogenase